MFYVIRSLCVAAPFFTVYYLNRAMGVNLKDALVCSRRYYNQQYSLINRSFQNPCFLLFYLVYFRGNIS